MGRRVLKWRNFLVRGPDYLYDHLLIDKLFAVVWFFSQVNLSCNFFKGRFDVDHYVDFLHQHWIALQILEEEQAKGSKKET